MTSKHGRSLNSIYALALAALTAAGISGTAMAFQDEGTVRIGVLESLSGTYAPFGIANMSGTIIAIDEINAAGGVTIDGKKVKIAVTPSPGGYDAGVDPAQSVTLLKRLLLDDKVLLIKGLSNSNSGTAVFNYLAELEKEGNPVVVHSSSVGTPGLTKLSNYAFRNSFVENADVINNLVSTVVKDTGAKTAGIYLIKDNPYYVSVYEKILLPALKANGVEMKVERRRYRRSRVLAPGERHQGGQPRPGVRVCADARDGRFHEGSQAPPAQAQTVRRQPVIGHHRSDAVGCRRH